MISRRADTAITRHGGSDSIGRLFVMPPSTYICPSIPFGMNTPGSEIDARTTSESFPSRKVTHSPVSILVAVMASGMRRSENDFPSKRVSRYFSIFAPLITHFFRSGSTSFIQETFAIIASISWDVFPSA